MKKKTTSIKVEPELWKDLKVYCAGKEITMNLFIERQIKKGMEEEDGLSNVQPRDEDNS